MAVQIAVADLPPDLGLRAAADDHCNGWLKSVRTGPLRPTR
ncbi:hypothetical protein [Xanthomonas perforans]|nr:hypothetical protein [Xanthomonas perforans]